MIFTVAILAQEGDRIADKRMGCGTSKQSQYEAEKAATEQAAADAAEKEFAAEKAVWVANKSFEISKFKFKISKF